MKHLPLVFTFIFSGVLLFAQKARTFDVTSLNGNIKLHVEAAGKIKWSVQQKGQTIIEPSSISLQLQNKVLGDNAVITSSKTEKKNSVISAINYIKSAVPDEYNQLTINCK